MKKTSFCVVGMGFVGLSNALCLSRKHKVYAYDIDLHKLSLIREKKLPIKDELRDLLRNKI